MLRLMALITPAEFCILISGLVIKLGSIALSDVENRIANKQLLNQIKALGLIVMAGDGLPYDSHWNIEHGFSICNVS
ncbi:DUF3293 domain-containing protein [Pelagibaculum spongiae]|uniref:Uncharacterized protein n=1 Tax=Pelagibaculum spongiae TaxID=2080658 RepID=A0A2V1GVB2_9GAMM|nr:DUF3293 domain-containing protein [Pelagibaculum spongiae]PVZ63442.1 hypothetical protein DC094_21275 [Pelagibaculum spongiae]